MKLKTIDNFLEDKDIQILSNLKLKECRQDKMEVYHNSISKIPKLDIKSCSKFFYDSLFTPGHKSGLFFGFHGHFHFFVKSLLFVQIYQFFFSSES